MDQHVTLQTLADTLQNGTPINILTGFPNCVGAVSTILSEKPNNVFIIFLTHNARVVTDFKRIYQLKTLIDTGEVDTKADKIMVLLGDGDRLYRARAVRYTDGVLSFSPGKPFRIEGAFRNQAGCAALRAASNQISRSVDGGFAKLGELVEQVAEADLFNAVLINGRPIYAIEQTGEQDFTSAQVFTDVEQGAPLVTIALLLGLVSARRLAAYICRIKYPEVVFLSVMLNGVPRYVKTLDLVDGQLSVGLYPDNRQSTPELN